MIDLGPLGDRAWIARFPVEPGAASWAAAVRSLQLPGVVEVILAYATVAVFADPARADLDLLEARLRTVEPATLGLPTGRAISIPVLYDGEDLPAIARATGLSVDQVIAAHAGATYRVFAVGFRPGFPYLGYLPEALSGLPRRAEPRLRVAAGSVALAARQTGIYPSDSPGGWHLLGRTPLRIVDLAAAHFPIEPGDSIRFAPIGEAEFRSRVGEPLAAGPPRAIELDR